MEKKRRIFVKHKTVESAPNQWQETNEPSVKFHLSMDRRQSESELHFNYKHICAKMFKLKQNIKTEVVCKHLVSEAIHKQSFPKMFPHFHKDLFQKNLSAPIAPVSLIIFRLNKLIGTARRIDSWWFVLGLCATYVGVAQKSTSFWRKREPWISRWNGPKKRGWNQFINTLIYWVDDKLYHFARYLSQARGMVC